MGIKYTSLTKKAMMICFETHKNQKDKTGGALWTFYKKQ